MSDFIILNFGTFPETKRFKALALSRGFMSGDATDRHPPGALAKEVPSMKRPFCHRIALTGHIHDRTSVVEIHFVEHAHSTRARSNLTRGPTCAGMQVGSGTPGTPCTASRDTELASL